ncbi:hypothetical protein J4U02_gp116 [Mycobacterium phage Aziz]|uniref:Uncharacterized protein n=1 Tax=Mycobacterium phage Aziz TaxID=2762281 RepID=A0A7G8LHS4_9CAUD|nr:hypothetical protein J4U02_gp116 [Mycobacterium phage Aziz]ASR75983.1 hypothetical protein SEA_GENEVAB15_162 [Mycobacterium phage GenevaB15]QNJ56796.1 hypothetical protein SEA_AZIZ_158 [Mycobacterium phage Aziz]
MELTIADTQTLGFLIAAVSKEDRVHILKDSDDDWDDAFKGVLRSFCNTEHTVGGDWHTGSILDKWVRVSATLEHWMKVSDLLDGLREGRVMFSSR